MLSPSVGLLTQKSLPNAWVQVTVVGSLLLLGYAPLFPGLITDWYEHSTFSYCFLVPFIVAYLIGERWEKIKTASVEPTIWGAIPLLMAVLFGVVGQAADDAFALRVSMILVFGSTAWLLLGRRVFKALLFPLFYLALMIPVPYVLLKDITYHLRYLDAIHAANVLQLLGVPVYNESYFLHLPNMTLEVADVCSGVSSVFALFAIGMIYAYFLPLRTGLKIVLVMLTFPLAVAANLFRIIVTAILAYNFGPGVFQSTFHAFSGMVTFLLALSMFVGVGEILRTKWPYRLSLDDTTKDISGPLTDNHTVLGWSAFVFAVALLTISFYALRHFDRDEMHIHLDLTRLTLVGGSYSVAGNAEGAYADSNAQTSFSRMFVDQGGHHLEVFVGYRSDQRSGNRLRSPKLFFPDKGNFVWVRPVELPVTGAASVLGYWMLVRNEESRQLVLSWYQIGKQTYGGELAHRFEQLRRALFERRTDGAVIRLATPLEGNDSIEAAEERLRTLGSNLYPQLVQFLPR